MAKTIFIFCIIGASLVQFPLAFFAYSIPPIRFEVLQPKGFEVSIPGSDGVTLFAFHGNLNEELEYRKAGKWSKDVRQMENGRFIFRDRTTKLIKDDVIKYWVYVENNQMGYEKDDLEYKVPADNCTYSETKLIHEMPCGKTLIFEDNFDTFDSSIWRMEQRFSGAPDFEFVIYMNQTVLVENNMLTIQPMRLEEGKSQIPTDFGSNRCTGQIFTEECTLSADPSRGMAPIASGQISTINSFSFLYGNVEVRARLPNADWVFPQIYLSPTDNFYGTSDYISGQIRIANAGGSQPLTGGLIMTSAEPLRMWKMCNATRELTDDFHVFSMSWTPGLVD